MLLFVLAFIWSGESHSQQLIKTGNNSNFSYRFKGQDHYKDKNGLVFAMAYTASREVSDVEASITYTSNFRIIKNNGQGFETIIHVFPPVFTGVTKLLDFDFSREILPRIETLKLTYTNGNEFIYVKSFQIADSTKNHIYLKFDHQRYSSDWKFKLEVEKWHFAFDEEEFQKKWQWVNDYQMALDWLVQLEKKAVSSQKQLAVIQKIRQKQWLTELEKLSFYQELIIKNHDDPRELEKKINIRKFVLQQEIESLNADLSQTSESPSAKEMAEAYFKIETDLLSFSAGSTNLFGDLYFAFEPKSEPYFCMNNMAQILTSSAGNSQQEAFEYEIQRQSIGLISQLIDEKKPREALFQVERLGTFYKLSKYLTQTTTFNHFKAKAVYDIYLSYIDVSRQAIERNRFEMAEKYLDQATEIQQKYPSEIINNLYAEKEKHELVRRALSRYNDLIKRGEHEQAERVKKGIKGLMKKLGITYNQSPLNES